VWGNWVNIKNQYQNHTVDQYGNVNSGTLVPTNEQKDTINIINWYITYCSIIHTVTFTMQECQ